MDLFRRSPLTRLLVLSVIALAFAGCAALPPTSEALDWKVGDFVLTGTEKTGWKGIRGDETLRLLYVKRGETSEHWTEKAEVTELPIAITFGGRVSWNPESVMNAEKANLQKNQCSTDMWTVLHKDETSILYEWQNIKCPGYFHQQEIVRIVMGRWYLWFISYGIRDKTFSADKRAALIENLLKAKVIHN
jgi:hypothetical protein